MKTISLFQIFYIFYILSDIIFHLLKERTKEVFTKQITFRSSQKDIKEKKADGDFMRGAADK